MVKVRNDLKSEIVQHMKKEGNWHDSLLNDIPNHWENYKGFIIFPSSSFKSPVWYNSGNELWERICQCLKGYSIAIKGRIKDDPFRSPQICMVYGSSSIVNYIDNKIKYTWDAKKIMFSAGNVTERHRIASLNCNDQVIVDMFAGIGYFTLPYLVHAKARFVHACEWNPDAIMFLRMNLVNNGVSEKCSIYEGDNRQVCPKGVADIVNVGLIPSSEDFWNVACEALRPSGGFLYIHQNVTSVLNSCLNCENCSLIISLIDINLKKKNQNIPTMKLSFCDNKYSFEEGTRINYWKHYEWFLFSLHISHTVLKFLENMHFNSWMVTIENIYKVKSYAPHIDHLVFSVFCHPKG